MVVCHISLCILELKCNKGNTRIILSLKFDVEAIKRNSKLINYVTTIVDYDLQSLKDSDAELVDH